MNFTNGYYDYQGNFIANNNNGIFDYIKVKPNTSYAFSFSSNVFNISIVEFDSSKKYIQRNNVSSVNKEIITTSNTTSYIRIGTNLTNSPTVTKQAVKSLNPQLEVNSSETSYVPHQEQNLPLTLGNIELNKIDTAQDYFYKNNGKWYKHEEIKKLIFNGNEQWERQVPTHTNVINLYFNIIPYGRAVGNSTVFCNIARYGSAGGNNDTVINVCQPNSNGGNFLIDLSLSEFPDINSFKTYLQGNNMELIYRLADTEITDIEITDTTLINQLNAIQNAMSYYEQTNISSTSSEISAVIEANAVGDLNLIIS